MKWRFEVFNLTLYSSDDICCIVLIDERARNAKPPDPCGPVRSSFPARVCPESFGPESFGIHFEVLLGRVEYNGSSSSAPLFL